MTSPGPMALALGLATLVTLSVPTAAAEPAPTPPPLAHLGEEVCLTSEVDGAQAEVCARRERFGATWDMELTDTLDDDRAVKASIALEVVDGPDPSVVLSNDRGAGRTARASGDFRPRVGSAIGDISIETCVVVRLGPDRCRTRLATLPQLTSRATPAQRARLEQLTFELPLDEFLTVSAGDRIGIDADFDWQTDGCSAGPFIGLVDERLTAACIRHDFGYRNLGQLFFDPTDDVRRRVDEQLGIDARATGQGSVATSLTESLQLFGAPAFFGSDLPTLWPVPELLVPFLRTQPDEAEEP